MGFSIGVPSVIIGTISQAAIAENNSDIIVISKGGEIEKSIDGGSTFVSIKSNLPGYSIEDIAFDPNNDDVIIVVFGRYQNDDQKIYMTINGGISWENITYNIGNMPIRSVVIDHSKASNIYIGAEIGVFTKPMNSNSWILYNNDLPNTTIEELEIVYGSNTVKAATWGRGLWEYSLVGRIDYPAIITTRITDQPTDIAPELAVDQFVNSTISYGNTLSSVYVEWSVNAPTFGNVIPMTNTIDSTWVSDTAIPNQTAGRKVYFRVIAVGNNNDTTETYKFMYKIPGVVGILEAESSVVGIFPNPTSNNFTIKLDKKFSTVSVELLNTIGQNIVSKTIKDTDLIKMNLKNSASGIYFLKVDLNGTKSVHKIIKK